MRIGFLTKMIVSQSNTHNDHKAKQHKRQVSMLYEWLKDYRKLEDEISFIEFNLDRSERELKRWEGGDLQKTKLHPESIASNLEETIDCIEYELAHKMNDMFNMTKMISSFVGLEHKILYMKYIEGMTLERVAEELKYSAQYIYNKHAEIKRMIDYAQGVTH